MPGPQPSHPGARARVNKTSTAAELVEAVDRASIEVPELPESSAGMWQPEATEWWRHTWQSPMRSEWDDSDAVQLLLLVYMLDELLQVLRPAPTVETTDAGETVTTAVRVDVLAAAKLHKQFLDGCKPLGLNPMARRSLQWMIISNARGAAEAELAAGKVSDDRDRRSAPQVPAKRGRRRFKGLE